MATEKYYDWSRKSVLDPENDGCGYEEWQEQYLNYAFAVHPSGFLVFLNPEELSSSDEYDESDPYSVEENLHSEFQQRRIHCTLELVNAAIGENRVNARILDLGCGEGHLTAEIYKHFPSAEISGLDYSLSAIDYASKHFDAIDFAVASAYAPPYAEGYFDLVICNNLWEHVPDPLFMLGKIRKILKTNGCLIISTPSRYRMGNMMRILRGKPVNLMSKLHVTEYSVGQVMEQLRFGGFETVKVYSKQIAAKPTTLKGKIIHRILMPALRSYLQGVNSHHNLEQTVFYLAKK